MVANKLSASTWESLYPIPKLGHNQVLPVHLTTGEAMLRTQLIPFEMGQLPSLQRSGWDWWGR